MRLRDDRGQTLLLAPIALLIVVIMGAVTLEVASLHLQQRRLDDLADSLANDAATIGFDVAEFRGTGNITIDMAQASTIIGPAIGASTLQSASMTSMVVPAGAPDTIQINLVFDHEFVLGRSIFGASTQLTATGSAELVPSA